MRSQEQGAAMTSGKGLSIFRLLEKLRAGFGAAGLVAVLAEGLFSSGGSLVRVVGTSLPLIEKLGSIVQVIIPASAAVIAFIAAYFFSDITDDEHKRGTNSIRSNKK